jgi:uncharacterized lipoprotein YehR (DUF1307 family)
MKKGNWIALVVVAALGVFSLGGCDQGKETTPARETTPANILAGATMGK